MKKLILLSLAVVLCLPVVVYAASIGGAETQGKGRLAVGLDSAFIFDRDLEFKSASGLAANGTLKNVKIDRGYQIMLKPSYGLFDNLDVYAKLGAADYEGKDESYIGGVKDADDKTNTDTDFAYGFGMKGTYGLGNDWLIGCDLQYLRSEHKAKVTATPVAGVASSTTYKTAESQEWHIAPYIARKINSFTPYLGIRYSDMKTKLKGPAEDGWADNVKSEADDNVGVFLGTDYKIGENWKLNLEGRFVDETAMSFGATYKF